MGHNTKIKSMGLALLTSSVLSTSAIAGGFDRGGVNIDQLFDEGRFGASAQVTYVSPQRTLENLSRPGLTSATNPNPAANITSNVEVDSDYVVPRFGFKFGLGESTNCLASYSEPFGGDADYGTGNIYSASAVEFSVEAKDYGLTCSHSFAAGTTSVGDSFIKLIVGGSYQELDGFQSRQSLLFGSSALAAQAGQLAAAAAAATDPVQAATLAAQAAAVGAAAQPQNGIGTFTVGDETFGWRAGLAYEIPDIALRASIVYNSKYDYTLTGIQDNSGFGPTAAAVLGAGLFGAQIPVFIETEIPQSLDIKFQSGIREGTLAFVNLRWQDWSQLDILPIQGSTSTLAFEPGYRDGYTVTAGLGQVITENLAARVALTWDRGTSTGSGTQTDSWTFSGGLRYSQSENLDFNIGGAIGILEGGTSTPLPNSIDASNAISYDFDADIVYAVSGGLKYKF